MACAGCPEPPAPPGVVAVLCFNLFLGVEIRFCSCFLVFRVWVLLGVGFSLSGHGVCFSFGAVRACGG